MIIRIKKPTFNKAKAKDIASKTSNGIFDTVSVIAIAFFYFFCGIFTSLFAVIEAIFGMVWAVLDGLLGLVGFVAIIALMFWLFTDFEEETTKLTIAESEKNTETTQETVNTQIDRMQELIDRLQLEIENRRTK